MSGPAETFDRGLRHVRRYADLRPLVRWFRKARLFVFDLRPHELPKEVPKADWLNDNFVLPFRTVALEDRATCTMLEAADGYPQFGMPQTLRFLDVIHMSPEKRNDFCDSPDLERMTDRDAVTCFIEGQVRVEKIGRRSNALRWPDVTFIGVVYEHDDMCAVASQTERLAWLQPGHPANLGYIIDRNVSAALQEACALCDPETFILEEAPLSWVRREQRDGGYERAMARCGLRGSHERPVYRVLKPRHARERMGIEAPDDVLHGARRPHERRGHWRLLKAERFTKKRGQRVWVSPCWVGPSQSVRGNRRYRVVLDTLGGHHERAAVQGAL